MDAAQLLAAILASSVLTAIATSFLGRRKTRAEAYSETATGDSTYADMAHKAWAGVEKGEEETGRLRHKVWLLEQKVELATRFRVEAMPILENCAEKVPSLLTAIERLRAINGVDIGQ